MTPIAGQSPVAREPARAEKPSIVHVTASSRLHFGLFSFGGPGLQFGGVGAMIDRPTTVVRAERSETFEVVGLAAERVREFVRRWCEFHHRAGRDSGEFGAEAGPPVRIEVECAAASHAGLGSGTQLALAVAASLHHLFVGDELPAPGELAASVGRGRRSAIGTHGFCVGGLLVDEGKREAGELSRMADRVALPAAWRFVLVRPRVGPGLHGEAEAGAFQALPAVDAAVSQYLRRLAYEQLVPTARAGDYLGFAAALHEFGREAGLCFAAEQGGPYNGPVLTRWVERLRELGAVGIGQSSWGPTLFALSANAAEAQELVARLQQETTHAPLDVDIAAPDNQGARIWRNWA